MIDIELAQNIVEKMKETINQELNFFSIDGEIIASTDPTRIGQKSHGGAKLAIETKDAVVIEYDGQYHGGKEGINLPVIVENKTIGAIGITGKRDEVLQFGKIIEQMTEIMIMNNSAREIFHNRRSIHQNIISQIMQPGSFKNIPLNMLHGIDLDLPRIAIMGRTNTDDYKQLVEAFSSIHSKLEKAFKNDSQTLLELQGNMLTIIYPCEKVSQALKITEHIQTLLKQDFNLDFDFGLGLPSFHRTELKRSLTQAATSLDWTILRHETSILPYQDMEAGLVLNKVDQVDQDFFLNKVFHDLETTEIDKILDLLNIYEKHNGSLRECAAELFIHKNTLQYKLNKITQQTGYNPRRLDHFFILKMASILYKVRQNH